MPCHEEYMPMGAEMALASVVYHKDWIETIYKVDIQYLTHFILSNKFNEWSLRKASN